MIVKDVACPTCRQPPGEMCIEFVISSMPGYSYGTFVDYHASRFEASVLEENKRYCYTIGCIVLGGDKMVTLQRWVRTIDTPPPARGAKGTKAVLALIAPAADAEDGVTIAAVEVPAVPLAVGEPWRLDDGNFVIGWRYLH